MKYQKVSLLVLIGLIIIGFFLRVWQVSSVPAILNRDEAALAYNALLLKETGKDEWGQAWPLALESFGDYKLPGYVWTVIGSFAVFGYSDFAVRFPSVLAGTLLILLAFLFSKDVLETDEKYALLAAFFVTFQPVFFFYSRIAFEANVALTLMVASLYLLMRKGRRLSFVQQVLNDSAAILLFLAAVFTYNTPLLLLPFLLPVIVYWRGITSWKKWTFPLIGLIIVGGIGFASLLSLSKQKSGITIFSDESVWKESVDYHNQFSGITQKILGNRVVFFGKIIVENYSAEFSPVFLVERGGAHPWHQPPGFGHIYWTIYILSWLGIISIVVGFLRTKKKKKLFSFEFPHFDKKDTVLFYLFLVAPLPAAVTVDAPHATRSLFFFFVFVMFAVVDLEEFLLFFHSFFNRKNVTYAFVAIIIAMSLETVNYMGNYFLHYPSESNVILHGGFAQKINELEETAKKDQDAKVAVIDPDGFQYILAAWYLKMSPTEFFATVDKHLPDKIGFRYGYKIGRYRFIVSPNDRFPDENYLLSWSDQTAHWEIQKLQ